MNSKNKSTVVLNENDVRLLMSEERLQQVRKELVDLVGEEQATSLMNKALAAVTTATSSTEQTTEEAVEILTKKKESIMNKLKQIKDLGFEVIKDSAQPIKETGKKAIGNTAIGVGKAEETIGNGLIKLGTVIKDHGIRTQAWGQKFKKLSPEAQARVRESLEASGVDVDALIASEA